ncbi:MAG: DUF3631 domain-containing protein [Gordonia sp. (in: high G+C Gram-positive bacteria)]|uniref:DUF3631 domain-containing protein n=1 Tax=Gordonia sp. (in: high G+C Gram-positive bacteria) TaxID=84139 RepID=UPI003C716F64
MPKLEARKLDPRLEAVWNNAITARDGSTKRHVTPDDGEAVTPSEEAPSQVRGGENPGRDGGDHLEGVHVKDPTLHGLLNDVDALLRRFVVLPNDRMFAGLALWVALTYLMQETYHAPRLLIRAAVNNSGKSTVAEILAEVCYNPWYRIAPTPASVKNEIAGHTAILDEMDNVDKNAFDQTFNGWKKGNTTTKMDDKGKDAVNRSTFAPMCVVGNGTFPSTLTSRALVISMKPATAREAKRLEEWDPEVHDEEAWALRDRFEQFAADLEEGAISKLDVEVPAHGREKQKWRPLFRIAEFAGGRWPELARQSHEAFSERVADDRTHSNEATVLLRDLRTVFAYVLGPDDKGVTTAAILKALTTPAVQDEDWPELLVTSTGETLQAPLIDTRWEADDLDANRLGRILRESVEVKATRTRTMAPRSARGGDQRGYLLADLLDSFERLVF